MRITDRPPWLRRSLFHMPIQKEADTELLRALIGYQRQKSDLEERIADIRRQLGGNTEGGEAAGPRSRVSAAGRRRMAERALGGHPGSG